MDSLYKASTSVSAWIEVILVSKHARYFLAYKYKAYKY